MVGAVETNYIELKDLEAYKFAREYCQQGWELYTKLSWQIKKIFGDQMIESIDSVGANIAEGYGRFHYLDKIKFYYNARGSLFESKHWTELAVERQLISKEGFDRLIDLNKRIEIKLNNLIGSQYKRKNQ
jgi:four helix bundle protein